MSLCSIQIYLGLVVNYVIKYVLAYKCLTNENLNNDCVYLVIISYVIINNKEQSEAR